MNERTLMNATVQAWDGRSLGIAQFGHPGGHPVLFMHGTPGSRMQLAPLLADALNGAGIHLVAVDRPGMGLSDPQPGRRIVDWPADLTAVADHLGLERFGLLGVSGGAPYALCAAQQLTDRVTGCAVVSGIGELGRSRKLPPEMNTLTRAAFWMAKKHPRLLAAAMRRSGAGPAGAKQGRAYRGLPARDREILARPDVWRASIVDQAEQDRQGPDGKVTDMLLAVRPWGFDVGSIAAPCVFWHGDEDSSAPVALMRQTAAPIRSSEFHVVSGGGHSLVLSEMEAIISSLREVVA